MIDWTFSPQSIILGFGWVVTGAFVLLGFFGKGFSDRRKESDKLADELIKRLQQTVEQQSKDLLKMQADMEKHTKARDDEIRKLSDDLKHLTGRNAVLEDLFKGRDPSMQAFLKDAPTLMTIAHENNGLARENAQGLSKLESTLSRFIDTLQPILIHAEIIPKQSTV